MSGVKEIIYPFFLKCTEYASDNYWNNIFENLSYGICPYNTYIHNNYFCCNHKVHKFKYYLLDREPKDLYTDIHKLLSNMGLISNKDKLNIYKLSNNKYDSWIDIKKKSIKQNLIEKFVINKKKEYNLDYSKTYLLLNKIILGILLKTINYKHIIYEDNHILDITCINFCKHDFKFLHDIYNYNSNYIVV